MGGGGGGADHAPPRYTSIESSANKFWSSELCSRYIGLINKNDDSFVLETLLKTDAESRLETLLNSDDDRSRSYVQLSLI